MNKADFRALFLDMKKYIKFNPFLIELNIPQDNFSHFLNGFNHSMSIENCYRLLHAIQEEVQKIA